MPDDEHFRRRYVLSLLARLPLIVPLLGGATLMILGALCREFVPDAGLWIERAGGVGLLTAGGMFLQSLIFGSETIKLRIREEMEREAQAARDRQIDALQADLKTDGDPRTDEALKDLRALMGALEAAQTWRANIDADLAADIMATVTEAFNRCLDALRESLVLYRAAHQVSDGRTRRSLADRREHIIKEVLDTVRNFNETLVGLTNLGPASASDKATRVSEVGRQLTALLNAAKARDAEQRQTQEEVKKRLAAYGLDAKQ